MGQFLDGVFSYVLAAFLVMFSFLVDNSNTVLTIGGMLLLAIRLYADGMRAYKTWKGEL